MNQEKFINRAHLFTDQLIRQYQFESENWKRLLHFLEDENIHFKRRLTEILKIDEDNKLLNRLEIFQSRFVQEDEWIRLLWHDVAEFDSLLGKEKLTDAKIVAIVRRKHKNLSGSMLAAQKHFTNISAEFIHFLAENI